MKNCKVIISVLFMSLYFVGMAFPDQSKSMQFIGKGLGLQKTDPFMASLEFKKAIDGSPQWDYPYILLADLYQKNFLFTEAVHNYEKALKLGLTQKGLEYQVISELGMLYIKTGEYDKAKETIKLAQKKKPGKLDQVVSDLELLLTTIDAMTNSPIAAYQVLNEILQRHSDWLSVYDKQCLAMQMMGDGDGAVRMLKKALQFNPVKCIALSDDTAGGGKGAYFFIRNPANNGQWDLAITIPAGTYSYRFILNYRYPDEKAVLDPENPKSFEKSPGLILNTLTAKEEYGEKKFHYQTFPADPIFINLEKKIASMRIAVLTNFYPQPGKYYLNPMVTPAYTTNLTFKYYNPNAYAVWAVGTFNQWGMQKTPTYEGLSPDYFWPLNGPDKNGNWILTTPMEFGAHQYNYLVDETYYAKDTVVNPTAFTTITNIQQFIGSPYSFLGYGELFPVEISFFRKNVGAVWIVGDFNYWGGTSLEKGTIQQGYYTEMSDPELDGYWHATLYLTKGKHYYQFVVNGTFWMVDPYQTTGMMDYTSLKNTIIVGEVEEKYDAEFVYNNPKAKSVWLAGEFNKWGGKDSDVKSLSPDYYIEMTGTDSDGNWKTTFQLPPGAYYYKYVIDGKHWLTDKDKEQVKVKIGASVSFNNIIYLGLKKFPEGQYLGIDNEKGFDVEFKYSPESTDVTNVWVIGDFNMWGGKYLFKSYIPGYYYPMVKPASGVWSFNAKLPTGKFQYRFVINGKTEISDKNSKIIEKDIYNKPVSVVEVGKE